MPLVTYLKKRVSMLLIGLIKNQDQASLIDPVILDSVEALHQYLSMVLIKQNLVLSTPITVMSLAESMKLEKPLIVEFGEHDLSLMMGRDDVIYATTSRFIHAGLLKGLADS